MTGRPATPLRVILVDDSASFLMEMRAYLLEFPGLEVVASATTGEQAVVLAELLAPDIVVMDVRMPGIGGIEATRVLKRLRSATSVLVLTLDDRDWVRRAALEAGADGFIVKDRLHDDFPAVLEALR